MSPYARGVVRGAMRGVMGMREECLHLCFVNFSALRCPRDLTNLEKSKISFLLKFHFIINLYKIMGNLWKYMVYLL